MARIGVRLLLVLMIIAGSSASAFPYPWSGGGQPVWPASPAAARIAFIRQWPVADNAGAVRSVLGKVRDAIFGKEEEQFFGPTGVFMSGDGHLYFASSGSGVVGEYSLDRQRFRRIIPGPDQLPWRSPVAVAVSDAGVVFVADPGLGSVVAIGRAGQTVLTLGKAQGLERPSGLFVFGAKIYVADAKTCEVIVFDEHGGTVRRFGRKGTAEGEFNAPTSIVVDPGGRIYVSDTLNCRVQMFDEEGKFIRSFGALGDVSGTFSRPKGVAVDARGHVYVVDALFDNVQVFDGDGRYLMNFGMAGHGDGEFWMPAGIFIDRDDFIYVADTYNSRVSIFKALGQRGQ